MKFVKVLAIAAVLAAPFSAQAATVTQQTTDIFTGEAGKLGGTKVMIFNTSTPDPHDYLTGLAGAFQLQSHLDIDGNGKIGDGTKGAVEKFIGFCVTPFTYLKRSGTSLVGNYSLHDDIVAGIKSLSLDRLKMLGALAKGAWDLMDDSIENAVAFQLAAWEIVAETKPHLSVYEVGPGDKNFRVRAPSKYLQATSIATANDWLSKLGTKGWELSTAGLKILTVPVDTAGRDTTQDLMTYVPPAPVPLPGALGMLAAGLAAFAAIGRARRA